MPKSRHRASHKAKTTQYRDNLREQKQAERRRQVLDRLRSLNPNALQLNSTETGFAGTSGVDQTAFSHLAG